MSSALLDSPPDAETTPELSTGPVLTVDLDAIGANTRIFAARIPGALMAVVKADGFGHDAVAVARTALGNGAGWLGVTSIAEGLALRADGLTAPILSWLNPVDADFTASLRNWIDVAVPSAEHLAAVVAAASRTGRMARVHLYADCGLARDGAPPSEWQGLCQAASRAERAGHVLVVGVMGHLACADRPDDPANRAGRRMFERSVATARVAGLQPQWRHLARRRRL